MPAATKRMARRCGPGRATTESTQAPTASSIRSLFSNYLFLNKKFHSFDVGALATESRAAVLNRSSHTIYLPASQHITYEKVEK